MNSSSLTREAKTYFSHASQSEIQYLFVWLFIISCKYSNPFPLEKVCLCMTGIQIGFIIVLYSLVQLSLEIKRNSFSRFSPNVSFILSEFLTQKEWAKEKKKLNQYIVSDFMLVTESPNFPPSELNQSRIKSARLGRKALSHLNFNNGNLDSAIS